MIPGKSKGHYYTWFLSWDVKNREIKVNNVKQLWAANLKLFWYANGTVYGYLQSLIFSIFQSYASRLTMQDMTMYWRPFGNSNSDEPQVSEKISHFAIPSMC